MGANYNGQLRDGTTTTTNLPEQIIGSNVVAIAAGDRKSTGGNLRCTLRCGFSDQSFSQSSSGAAG
jgi:hypothetical protein